MSYDRWDDAPSAGDITDVTVRDKSDGQSGGWVRALFAWLKGGAATPRSTTSHRAPGGEELPSRIGHYAILRKVGSGGMGVVYAARDERLERTVAVKMMSSVAMDETPRKRFWREARAAASVNHPNVCQIYEIGEDEGELFIAMEFLEGESLADRLQRGPLNVSETVPMSLGMLAALTALHARGIVHRDLKPSNVFLTPHGVKVLDFGVARPDLELRPATELTPTGMLIGTPRYMAPELVTGATGDARSDLFAVGAIMFEMLSGRPAFNGRTMLEVLHATLHEQPPALTGSPAVAAMDRLIRRALAKRPEERLASADEMARELQSIRGAHSDDTPVTAQALTRLVVLPFRVLRSDPESDFLAFSLPDAISTSLSGIGSLVVRSSAVAARFKGETPDLKAIASDADVDRVVMGTLLRSGDQVRASTQLVEAPGGTLLTSLTVQSSLDDLFRLQDDIARRVVEALSLPLGGAESTPVRDVPDAHAYGLYLRANELARTYEGLVDARELYQQSLELDPTFAPAWAHLGRCHRVIGKYVTPTADSEAQAEAAFRRALEINPRLSVAHRFYASLEADFGRAVHGMVRLVGEARRHGNDAELFAGLVHTCRFCGLFEEAIAAHAEARRLDPNVPSSVEQTWLMRCDFERVLTLVPFKIDPGADDGIRVIALGLSGRREEARDLLRALQGKQRIPVFRSWLEALFAWLDRRPADAMEEFVQIKELKIQDDPEAIFQQGWLLCDAGDHEHGLEYLRRAVDKGYPVAQTLAKAPQFDPLRDDQAFKNLLADAESGRRNALQAFQEAGGDTLLGR